MNSLDPKKIESMDVSKNSGKTIITIITKDLSKPVKISDKIIYINGVKSNATELNNLDQKIITSVDVNTTQNTVRVTTKTVTNTANNIVVNSNTSVNTSGNQIIKPLIIINGVKADPEITINDVPSKDIVSVNVIKGKSAEEKYGSEGKNGVVEISTKQNSWKVTSGVNGSDVLSAVTMNKNIDFKKAVIIIDGKISDYKALKKINSGDIKMVKCPDMNNYTEEQKNEAVKVYGEKAVNGFIEVQTTDYYEKHKNISYGVPALR